MSWRGGSSPPHIPPSCFSWAAERPPHLMVLRPPDLAELRGFRAPADLAEGVCRRTGGAGTLLCLRLEKESINKYSKTHAIFFTHLIPLLSLTCCKFIEALKYVILYGGICITFHNIFHPLKLHKRKSVLNYYKHYFFSWHFLCVKFKISVY